MRRDPTVFIVGEDVGKPGGPFGVTRGILDEFGPERAVDTPISEGTIIACARALPHQGCGRLRKSCS